jgi:hypothetical protein
LERASLCYLEHRSIWDNPVASEPPERNQQLAGKRDDENLAQASATRADPGGEPL